MPKPRRTHSRDKLVPRATRVLNAYLAPLAKRNATVLNPRECKEVATRWRNAYGEAPYPEPHEEGTE